MEKIENEYTGLFTSVKSTDCFTDTKITVGEYLPCRNSETDEIFFLPVVCSCSDYKWQLEALKSRLEHPEWYKQTENVHETVAKIKEWLKSHSPE